MVVSFVVDRLEEKMSELMERMEEKRPMLKDAAVRNMNMIETIAKRKIHLFSDFEDAIVKSLCAIFIMREVRSSQIEVASNLRQIRKKKQN